MSVGVKALFKTALELGPGEDFAAVAPVGRMRLRFNETTAQAELSISGSGYIPIGLGGASPWVDDGTVVRLADITDRVVIGAVMPVGTEKVRIVGDLLVNSTIFVNAVDTPTGGGSDLNLSADSGVVTTTGGGIQWTAGNFGLLAVDGANEYIRVDTTLGVEQVVIADALPAGTTWSGTGTTTTIPDNAPNAMVVFEGVNEYLRVDTTNGGESLTVADALPANTTWSGTGQSTTIPDNAPNAMVVFEGVNEYLRVDTTNGGESLTVADALPANTTWSGTGTTTNIPDNAPNALVVFEGVNQYLRFDTTNLGEQIIIGNAVTNPEVIIQGTGGLCSDVVCLQEQGADPAAEANRGKLYSKDVATITELFYRDSAGSVVQITTAGSIVGATDVSLTDNLATAYRIHEAANNYLFIVTSNGAESIRFGNSTTNPGYSFLGSGEATFDGGTVGMQERAGDPALAANTGKIYTKDVATITELFYINSGGSVTQITSGGSLSGATDVAITDNLATAYLIHEAANNYFRITTTNLAENVSIGNATTNPSFTFLGSGDVTMGSGLVVGATSASPVNINIEDNVVGSFRLREGATIDWINITTTNAAERFNLRFIQTAGLNAFTIETEAGSRFYSISTTPFRIAYGGDAGALGNATHNFRCPVSTTGFQVAETGNVYIQVDTSGARLVLGNTSNNPTILIDSNTTLIMGNAAANGCTMQFFYRVLDPAAVADTIKVYSKEVATVPELFARNEAGTVTQFTRGGAAIATRVESTVAAGSTLRILADGTGLGFFGSTPVSQRGPYSIAGSTPDRTYDVATVTLTELANVVAAILQDMGDVAGYGILNTDI